jgi:hypothetical protein
MATTITGWTNPKTKVEHVFVLNVDGTCTAKCHQVPATRRNKIKQGGEKARCPKC